MYEEWLNRYGDICEKRVGRGIMWLDKFMPRNWVHKIDLEDLHIFDCSRCVLAQIFDKDFEEALDKLGIDEVDAIKMGFNAEDGGYAQITQHFWEKELEELQRVRDKDERAKSEVGPPNHAGAF